MTNIRLLPLAAVEIETDTNEDWLDAVTFLDANGAPIDLSGISFASVLRPTAPSQTAQALCASDPTFEGRPAVGRLIASGATLAWAVPASVMSKVPPGLYVVDVIAMADDTRLRVITGKVTIGQGITR